MSSCSILCAVLKLFFAMPSATATVILYKVPKSNRLYFVRLHLQHKFIALQQHRLCFEFACLNVASFQMAFKNKFYVTDAGISWQHRCYAQFRVPVNMSTGKMPLWLQLSYLRRCCITCHRFAF